VPDPYKKVRPGEPIPTSAALWNKLIELVDDRLDRRSGDRTTTRDANIVRVLNEAGADLPRTAVVALRVPVFTPTDSLDAFLREPTFRGTVPSTGDEGRFGVLLEPAPQGRVVRAYVAGVCAVRVDVVDESHTCCDIDSGNTAALVSMDGGSAQILWREGFEEGYGYETGEQWAVIRIGSACSGAASYY
jgi:hypothetical protein